MVNSANLSPDARYLISASLDGTARLWDVATGKELLTLFGMNDGQQWLVVSPDGLFDGSRMGREMISFRFAGGLQVVPVDRFFQDFYRPGLLSEMWDAAIAPPPRSAWAGRDHRTIRIVSPAGDREFSTQRISLDVDVIEQGGGIRGPWLVQIVPVSLCRAALKGTTIASAARLRRI